MSLKTRQSDGKNWNWATLSETRLRVKGSDVLWASAKKMEATINDLFMVALLT